MFSQGVKKTRPLEKNDHDIEAGHEVSSAKSAPVDNNEVTSSSDNIGHRSVMMNEEDDVETAVPVVVPTCRICLDEADQDNPLYHPCKCSGSMKYIHKDCLLGWANQNPERGYKCEVCREAYTVIKFYRDGAENLSVLEYCRLFITEIIDQPTLIKSLVGTAIIIHITLSAITVISILVSLIFRPSIHLVISSAVYHTQNLIQILLFHPPVGVFLFMFIFGFTLAFMTRDHGNLLIIFSTEILGELYQGREAPTLSVQFIDPIYNSILAIYTSYAEEYRIIARTAEVYDMHVGHVNAITNFFAIVVLAFIGQICRRFLLYLISETFLQHTINNLIDRCSDSHLSLEYALVFINIIIGCRIMVGCRSLLLILSKQEPHRSNLRRALIPLIDKSYLAAEIICKHYPVDLTCTVFLLFTFSFKVFLTSTLATISLISAVIIFVVIIINRIISFLFANILAPITLLAIIYKEYLSNYFTDAIVIFCEYFALGCLYLILQPLLLWFYILAYYVMRRQLLDAIQPMNVEEVRASFPQYISSIDAVAVAICQFLRIIIVLKLFEWSLLNFENPFECAFFKSSPIISCILLVYIFVGYLSEGWSRKCFAKIKDALFLQRAELRNRDEVN